MRLVISAVIVLISTMSQAQQTPGIWTDKQELLMRQAGERNIIPDRYRTIQANVESLQNVLANAPEEKVT